MYVYFRIKEHNVIGNQHYLVTGPSVQQEAIKAPVKKGKKTKEEESVGLSDKIFILSEYDFERFKSGQSVFVDDDFCITWLDEANIDIPFIDSAIVINSVLPLSKWW